MRILRNILVLLFVTTAAVGQQINPVPDYIFRNQMSVGRNAPTDTAAYLSIGPRFGANKGFQPPMVVDTASFSGSKRNGLTIFSVQRNKYVYWDSIGAKWAEMAGTAGNALTSADTANLLSTRAWRQKGIDSVANVRIGGTGVAGYVPDFSATRTLDTTRMFYTSGRFGIGTTSPLTAFHNNGELMTTRMVVDTINGSAYTSPWRALGVRTQFEGVTHWWGRTNAGGGASGGGDFTFFKSRSGDSALVTSDEIWYLQFRGKHRTNDANWSTNDSSNVANFVVNFATHSNGTPTAIYQFRAKNSAGISTQYLIIDPLVGDVDINNSRLDVQRNLLVRDNAIIEDTLLVGTVNTLNSNTFGNGQLGIARNGFSSINFTAYDAVSGLNSGYMGFVRARGSASSPAVVQSGDFLGVIAFDGFHNPGAANPARGAAQIRVVAEETFSSTATGASIRFLNVNTGSITMTERMRIFPNGRIAINTTTDAGAFFLQVNGVTYSADGYRTANPTGGTAATWRLGTVATVSPTSPNRTIEVEIGGTLYYIHAKTTND